MIRNSFLSLALLGVLFSNTALAATPQDDIQCKVEQGQINTAVVVESMVMQTYRACTKGFIANLEVIANVQFNGGTVDMGIMDSNMMPRAVKTFTTDNYNGSSLVLNNLSIPALQNDQFIIMIKAYNGASLVLPATDDASEFVGEFRNAGNIEAKNLKFTAGFRGGTPDYEGLREGDNRTSNKITSAHARVAAGLELEVKGDCETAQRNSTGVLNFEQKTFMQMFYACDLGVISEIKLATPFVQPGVSFNYALIRPDNSVITSGTFTSEDVVNEELVLKLNKGAVRENEAVLFKVNCPLGARLTTLATGTSDDSFGRLYVNGQSLPYNLAMAVGFSTRKLDELGEVQDEREDLEIGAYPVPFGESLSITIRGSVKAGATLQLLNHQGMTERVMTLAGGQLQAPIRFTDLDTLRPGLYTIRLINGDKVFSKRILKG